MLQHWRATVLATAAAVGLSVSAALAGEVVLQLGDQTIVGPGGKFQLRDGTYLVIDPKSEFASHLRGAQATPANGTYQLRDGRSIPASFGRIKGATIISTR
jgi:hypothetical protein